MRAHFHKSGDEATASLFHPSSMEFVSAVGGTPLCVVTELPLFQVNLPIEDLEHPPSHELRDALKSLSDDKPITDLESLHRRFAVSAVPLDLQIRLQLAAIVLALDSVATAFP